ncbi:unnamed protein product [Amoebophrya sp. A120]|nr:unnamed protein product [Amoebophrya sp. A120]|eukprot:GSA120T00022807001.1
MLPGGGSRFLPVLLGRASASSSSTGTTRRRSSDYHVDDFEEQMKWTADDKSDGRLGERERGNTSSIPIGVGSIKPSEDHNIGQHPQLHRSFIRPNANADLSAADVVSGSTILNGNPSVLAGSGGGTTLRRVRRDRGCSATARSPPAVLPQRLVPRDMAEAALLFSRTGTSASLVYCEQVASSLKRHGSGGKKSDPAPEEVKYFRWAEIAEHNSIGKRVWVTYGDGVYDITDYLPSHPGGAGKVLQAAGKAVDPYWKVYQQHFRTNEALTLLEKYKIGEIHPDEPEIEYDDVDPYESDPENRDPRLIYHNLKACNAELPRHLQMQSWLTPDHLWFVRHHHPVAYLSEKTYQLQLATPAGLQATLTLDALKRMKSVTLPVTVQCGGNRRSHMNAKEKTSGIAWGTGGISTGAFTGVRLCDLLRKIGIADPDAVEQQNIKHIVFHAKDGMSASIPVEHALDPYGGALLAWDMNGKPLSAEHGFPLRLVVPGQVGVRHVKWVTKIEASTEEAHGPWQRGIAYKGFPPSLKDFKDADPEKIPSMQKVPVQSVICFPATGDALDVQATDRSNRKSGDGALSFWSSLFGANSNSSSASAAESAGDGGLPPTAETYGVRFSEKLEPCVRVRGWAYSGGGNGIVRVDVSSDNGTNWHTAELKQGSEQPINRAYAWTFWEIDLPLAKDAAALKQMAKNGEQPVLVCKAIDASYNVQPETVDGIWNARGLNNTSWHRVPLKLQNPGA